MLSGSIVALATPFCEDGSVNFERLGEWIEFQIENGTDGILVLGTTGESSTMSHEEDDAVCAYAVEKVAGRAKVIAGSGSGSLTLLKAPLFHVLPQLSHLWLIFLSNF